MEEKWYSAYKRDGSKAIKVKKSGRPKNVGKTLSDEQESKIIRLLIDKNPLNYNLNLHYGQEKLYKHL